MSDINRVLENVRNIGCQADRIEHEIANAFNGYDFRSEGDVKVDRREELDKEDLQAYSAYVDKKGEPAIIAMVCEGLDHYVATVKDAYIE